MSDRDPYTSLSLSDRFQLLAFEAELAHLPRSLISALWEVMDPSIVKGALLVARGATWAFEGRQLAAPMTKKRTRPMHLTTPETPPENRTIAVLSPAPWHFPPLELVPMLPERVSAFLQNHTTFDGEVVLARQYHAWCFNSRQSAITCDLAEEAAVRVEQLNFLLKSVLALMPSMMPSPQLGDAEAYKIHYQAWFLMELYTESFYYIAHRLQTICEDEHSCLPHLEGYQAVEEVQIVRNQLLEHPEGRHSGVTERRWTIRSDVGPVVKDSRRPGQPTAHRDTGLYPTSEKLRVGLFDVFTGALKAIAAKPADYAPIVES